MKKTLKLMGFLSILILSGYSLEAQTEEMGIGCLFSKEKAEAIQLTPHLSTKSYQNLPKKISLKQYTATPGHQYKTGTCVGWALSGARTMIEAIQKNHTSRSKIDQYKFSPSYVYNQIKASQNDKFGCDLGAFLEDGLELMKTEGCLPMSQFPFNPSSCNKMPSESEKGQAADYKIKDFTRLTIRGGGSNEDDISDNTKVMKVKKSLSEKLPVVIGMFIYDNFMWMRHANDTWNSTKRTSFKGGHAMVVVGYDDDRQAFELMNSWGTDWGEDGFLWVKYKDFNKFVMSAYEIHYTKAAEEEIAENDKVDVKPPKKKPTRPDSKPDKPDATPDKPSPKPDPVVRTTKLSANIVLNELKTVEDGGEISCTGELKGQMKGQLKNGVYQLATPTKYGTGYQIEFTTKVPNMVAYVVSIDKSGEANLLFPFSPEVAELYEALPLGNSVVSPILAYKESNVVIPHDDFCMQLDKTPGTLNVLLFAKESIDMKSIMKRLKTSKAKTATEKVQAALGGQMADANLINYTKTGIGFSAKIPEDKIVPIIIDMNHQ